MEEQSQEHRLWRLALHRMDIRGFHPVEAPTELKDVGGQSREAEQQGVYFGPGEIEDDIQAMLDHDAPIRAQREEGADLLNWGWSAWQRDDSADTDLAVWQTKLVEAQEFDRSTESEEPWRGGSGFITAVCVRDYWQDMEERDREWCIAKLITEIERNSETDSEVLVHAHNPLRPDRAAAFVLPRILRNGPPKDYEDKIRSALAMALTHAVPEVVDHAAEGIGYYLHDDQRDFALQCVGAVARQARLLMEQLSVDFAKPYTDRQRGITLNRSVASEVRRCLENGDLDFEAELKNVSLDDGVGQLAAHTILKILGYLPSENIALAFHRRVLEYLVEAWMTKEGTDSKFKREAFERICRFILRISSTDALTLCEPLLDAVPESPDNVASFVHTLIIAEDHSQGQSSFWSVWQALADQISNATWVETLDSRYALGSELVGEAFLGGSWKKDIRHWERLEGEGWRIEELVRGLPVKATVLRLYCRFLYHIGEQSLPDGFAVIADQFGQQLVDMLSDGNTVFYLETLLQRYVYGEPLELKKNSRIRGAVLAILDSLVEGGSSVAFRMRDDFVTPTPVLG